MSRITKRNNENLLLNSNEFFMNSYIPGNKIYTNDKDNYQNSSISIKKLKDLNYKLSETKYRQGEWDAMKQQISQCNNNRTTSMNQRFSGINSSGNKREIINKVQV